MIKPGLIALKTSKSVNFKRVLRVFYFLGTFLDDSSKNASVELFREMMMAT